MEYPKNDLNLSGFWHKNCAFIIDLLIIFTATLTILFLTPFLESLGEKLIGFLIFTVLFIYNTFSLALFETTPGRALMGLKVCDKSGAKLYIGQAFIRSLLGTMSLFLLGFGHLFSIFSKNKQTIHDLAANTLVKTHK